MVLLFDKMQGFGVRQVFQVGLLLSILTHITLTCSMCRFVQVDSNPTLLQVL